MKREGCQVQILGVLHVFKSIEMKSLMAVFENLKNVFSFVHRISWFIVSKVSLKPKSVKKVTLLSSTSFLISSVTFNISDVQLLFSRKPDRSLISKEFILRWLFICWAIWCAFVLVSIHTLLLLALHQGWACHIPEPGPGLTTQFHCSAILYQEPTFRSKSALLPLTHIDRHSPQKYVQICWPAKIF